MDEIPKSLIEYHQQSGIYIFKFKANSRRAVDEYLSIGNKILRQHIEETDGKVPHYRIIDISESGLFPINYMQERAITLIKQLPTSVPLYIAYLTDDPVDISLLRVVNDLAERRLKHSRQVFPPEQLDKAIEWLLSLKSP